MSSTTKSLSLSFGCGCAFAHNPTTTENTKFTPCETHKKQATAIELAQSIINKLNEFQRATGN